MGLADLRIALFADVHANREALAACLAHASERGYDRALFLGDLVGYCADPAWVLDEVVQRVRGGALALLGNHDDAVARGPQPTMHPEAAEVALWTRARIDPAHLEFLSALPPRIEEPEMLFVHANAWAPRRWEYVVSADGAQRSLAATGCRLSFFGHVHVPVLYHLGDAGGVGCFTPAPGEAIPLKPRWRWLVNPGSVGQPRDGIPAASYAIFDAARRQIEYHRVPFDAVAAAHKIRAAGLPERFAARLGRGV